jgi:hypothetical protein
MAARLLERGLIGAAVGVCAVGTGSSRQQNPSLRGKAYYEWNNATDVLVERPARTAPK